MALPYERPVVTDLGTLKELTQQDKDFGSDDGFTFQGQIIGNAS
jgi:hypothetical protein